MDAWKASTVIMALALVGVLVMTGIVDLNVDGTTLSDYSEGSEVDRSGQTAPSPTPAMQEARQTDSPVPYTTVALTDFKRQHLERRIAEVVNDKREQEGVSEIGYDARIARMARHHSEDMVVRNYFGHTGPAGESLADRYRSSDYDCANTVGSSQFDIGAEAIYQTWYKTRVDGQYYSSRDELARAVVNGWMQSDKYREELLETRWKDVGVGVALEDVGGDVMVVVTADFC